MTSENRGTCFVTMGFGRKTDFETGRILDLDKSYRLLIRPTVEAAGLQCIRADDVMHAGVIDRPVFEMLLRADVVIADLSARVMNPIYELGVRHALRPRSTIVMAEKRLTWPFDLSHVQVLRYDHRSEGIDSEEVERFRQVLGEAIERALSPNGSLESPVYLFLPQLQPPQLPLQAAQPVLEGAGASAPSSLLMQQATKAIEDEDFELARSLLLRLSEITPAESRAPNVEIAQRLALATYKSRSPTEAEALAEARRILEPLTPQTSNDVQTLRLWSNIQLIQWQLTGEPAPLDDALVTLKRGFYLGKDPSLGIDYAFALSARAVAVKRTADAVTDFVVANRVRREVLDLCEKWLTGNRTDPNTSGGASQTGQDRFVVLSALAEARLGLGHTDAQAALDEALATLPGHELNDLLCERLEQLRGWLSASPLDQLRVPSP